MASMAAGCRDGSDRCGFSDWFNVVPSSGANGAADRFGKRSKLADWRAPSDVLLQTPGREILWTTPRLGESYLHLPAKTDKEE